MLHGAPSPDGRSRNNVRSDPNRFELRNEVIRASLYNGSSLTNKDNLKRRVIPQDIAINFDEGYDSD
jgi:hypothetical protein